jgi:hypothetical protein
VYRPSISHFTVIPAARTASYTNVLICAALIRADRVKSGDWNCLRVVFFCEILQYRGNLEFIGWMFGKAPLEEFGMG